MGHPLPKMTVAEFLAWEETQEERHEFWRGETFAMVGAALGHHRVIHNLRRKLEDHLVGAPCEVFTETVMLQLTDGILYPDLMVVCGKANESKERTVSDPSLVIETLSPSTQGYDKRAKFVLYRTLTSLREYVLVDPFDRRIEVFTRAEAGAWTLNDQTGAESLVFASVDLRVPMAQVFKGVEIAT